MYKRQPFNSTPTFARTERPSARGGARGGGGGETVAVKMSWFAGPHAPSRGPLSVRAVLAAANGGGGGGGDDADADDDADAAAAVLFLRAHKGPYVCAGRLVDARAVEDDANGRAGARMDLALADADVLAERGRFDDLVGARLSAEDRESWDGRATRSQKSSSVS